MGVRVASSARVTGSARVAMGAWRAGRLPLPLAVLLALLRAVLLREVGDTVAYPMRPSPQRVLTALHLSLDLLTKRAVRRRGRHPGGATRGRAVGPAMPYRPTSLRATAFGREFWQCRACVHLAKIESLHDDTLSATECVSRFVLFLCNSFITAASAISTVLAPCSAGLCGDRPITRT